MKYFSSALRSGLAVAALALLPITELAAQVSWTPLAAPSSCNIPVSGGGNVYIQAGAGTTPNTNFPITGSCPSGAGTCLEWQYVWRYTGFNPSQSMASVASNVAVLTTTGTSNLIAPTSFDSSIGWGNVGGEVGIRFNSSDSTYYASIYTDINAVVGPVTAGFKSGNKTGFCQIQGAIKGNINFDLSTPKALVTTTLGCQATWTQSADGCVTGVAVPAGSACGVIPRADQAPVTKPNLLALHAASKTASCGTEINAPGSTNVCRYNSLFRTYTCVTIN